VLIDFGSCHFQGAERLTWQSLPPVTRAYLSPQAVLFYIRSLHHQDSYYAPSPADDLYALGVTAYRLVVGQYPAAMSASKPQAAGAQAPDAGTTAVGDISPTEPQAVTPSSKENRPIAQEPPPQPRPGQARPDEKGRCQSLRQVPINGGCWVEQLSMSAEECVESGYVPFKGKCYLPAPAPPKKPVPTSIPGETR
jgi:serine/threonine protein kinase